MSGRNVLQGLRSANSCQVLELPRTHSAGSKFCGECGQPVASGAPRERFQPQPTGSDRVLPEKSAANAVEGVPRTVTALFADIKGSTELEQDLDPEEARAMLADICNWFTEGFDTAPT